MIDSMSPSDAVNLFVSNLQKKHRNLVKRKGKLDHYRDMLNKGESLNEEQKKAVEGYEAVLQSITVVQEVLTQSKELVTDIQTAVSDSAKQTEIACEDATIQFLRTQICLMQLLNALENPDLRTAIIKASSPNQLKMLDIVKSLFIAPVAVDWPGTSASSLAAAPDFIQNQGGFDTSAKFMYNFVMGRSVPIPLPDNFEGASRKFNFKEARLLCFRLLAIPVIQRLLGAPSYTRSSNRDEGQEDTSLTHSSDNQLTPQVHITCEVQDKSRMQNMPNSFEPSSPAKLEDNVPNSSVLNESVKPLCGTFNFLQASKVLSPEPNSLEFPPGQLSTQPDSPAPNNLTHAVPEPQIDLSDVTPSGEEFRRGEETTYGLPSVTLESTSPVYENQVEADHTLPPTVELETELNISSKPACYADLFRQRSRVLQANGHRETAPVRKTQHMSAMPANEAGDLREMEDTEEHALHQAPSNRGRGGGDFRGGRGYQSRGFSRGFMNGAPRRPYGGQRIGRGGGGGPHPGRGRAAFQGPRTNMAQA